MIAILLCCTDDTARQRLSHREIGSALDIRLDRSHAMAQRLHAAPTWLHRIRTDNRSTTDIAAEIVTRTGWC
ncbi:hypothetical protein [Nocardia sp. IFM 10818]